MTRSRTFDLLVFGSTGFTGRFVIDALRESDEAKAGLRIGLVGRNASKLEGMKDRLCADGAVQDDAVSVIVKDSGDADGLDDVVKDARVVLTTVGPYLSVGKPLVAACAKAGTHYVDLTGEPPFIRHSIDKHHTEAQASGARIVHCCGFDSIPSDLGALVLQHAAIDDGGPCERVVYTMMAASGGFSGGTAHSLLSVVELAASDKDARRIMSDPYSLVPDGPRGPDKGERFDIGIDKDIGAVVGPFVMGPINTRVVRRSNALMGHRYGENFSYAEQMRCGRGLKGHLVGNGIRFALGAVLGLGASSAGRSILKRVFPAQGAGPSDDAVAKGFFAGELHGHRRDGAHFRAKVKHRKDPGYGGTADMIVESALRLLDDESTLGLAGVTTPAAALGMPLVERLRRRGMTFAAERVGA